MSDVLDTRSLIAELAAKHGIRIDENDPAVAIVALNCLVLEKSTEQVAERIRIEVKDFEEAIAKVQRRAGQLVAQEFNDHLAVVRASLQNDITLAGGKANEIIFRIEQANRYPVMIRWIAVGMASSLLLFALGVVFGWGYLPR